MNEYLQQYLEVADDRNKVNYYRVRGDSAKKFSDIVIDMKRTTATHPYGEITLSLPLDGDGCEGVLDAMFDMAETHGFIYAPTLEMMDVRHGEVTLNGSPFTEEEVVEVVKLVQKHI